MKSEQWKSYRTRFLVKAKQLSSSLSFVDHLGRQHCGRKGDYLVESSDGVLSIAPRRIFEDIYVPMSCANEASTAEEQLVGELGQPIDQPSAEKVSRLQIDRRHVEPLNLEKIKLRPSIDRPPIAESRVARHDVRNDVRQDEAARVRRKLPQPCRVRPSSSGFGVM